MAEKEDRGKPNFLSKTDKNVLVGSLWFGQKLKYEACMQIFSTRL